MLRAMREHQLAIDEDHVAALDTLLLLADAGARWGEHEHALDLLSEAEDAGCVLSAEYRMKRHFWDAELAS
jgi:pentatricopeptide repeat protein